MLRAATIPPTANVANLMSALKFTPPASPDAQRLQALALQASFNAVQQTANKGR